jgi:colanic acid/amylovoran biosynthesis protein
LLNIFANLDYLVATKTHSVVYGLRKCIPTLAIAYEKKTDDFMKDFQQEDFSVQLSTFNSEHAFNVFSNLVEKDLDVKNTIQNKLAEIQARSFENIELLSRFL